MYFFVYVFLSIKYWLLLWNFEVQWPAFLWCRRTFSVFSSVLTTTPTPLFSSARVAGSQVREMIFLEYDRRRQNEERFTPSWAAGLIRKSYDTASIVPYIRQTLAIQIEFNQIRQLASVRRRFNFFLFGKTTSRKVWNRERIVPSLFRRRGASQVQNALKARRRPF